MFLKLVEHDEVTFFIAGREHFDTFKRLTENKKISFLYGWSCAWLRALLHYMKKNKLYKVSHKQELTPYWTSKDFNEKNLSYRHSIKNVLLVENDLSLYPLKTPHL